MKASPEEFMLNTQRSNASFEPRIVKKRQTILNEELDNKIFSLYAFGTTLLNILADHK